MHIGRMGHCMKQNTYHHKNLKDELIEKGIEIVNESGLEQLSLRKVAMACNVSHAAPYSHFKNKEELIGAMQSHITEQFTVRLEETILKYEGKPNFLLEFGKAYITFFMEKPQYFQFLFQQGHMPLDLNLDGECEEGYRPFIIYKKQILKLLEHTNLSPEKKQDCVISLLAYIHGLTSLVTMPNVIYAPGWENKLEDLIMTYRVAFRVQ